MLRQKVCRDQCHDKNSNNSLVNIKNLWIKNNLEKILLFLDQLGDQKTNAMVAEYATTIHWHPKKLWGRLVDIFCNCY